MEYYDEGNCKVLYACMSVEVINQVSLDREEHFKQLGQHVQRPWGVKELCRYTWSNERPEWLESRSLK